MPGTGDKGVPLVWEHSSGSGRVVVDNIGIYDKVLRGVYAASYSLLCDATAYPVINGAVFYLDDFPSPVPGGDGTYIRRDYSMSIADFYSKVWWPDLMKLAQKYSIRFTGVMIENYEDDTVDAPTRQPGHPAVPLFWQPAAAAGRGSGLPRLQPPAAGAARYRL